MSYKQNFRDVGAPDTFLSNFSVSYWQDTSLFVGTRYFPVVPVNQAAGKFYGCWWSYINWRWYATCYSAWSVRQPTCNT
jgi:hypothetical protein